MSEYAVIITAGLGHGSGSFLTHANAVTITFAFKSDPIAFKFPTKIRGFEAQSVAKDYSIYLV